MTLGRAVRRRRPRAPRRRAGQAGRRAGAHAVRARPGPGRALRLAAAAGRQDAGARPAGRRLRAQPAHPQPRGRADRPRPGPPARLPPRPRRDRGAGPRPRAPAVRAQRRARARRAGSRLRRVRGQRPDAAHPDPARGQVGRRRGSLGRAEPDPGLARRVHEVPLARRRRRARPASSASTTTTCRVFTWLRAGVEGLAPLRRGAGDGPRRRRRLLRARPRGRHRRRSHRPRAARRRRASGRRCGRPCATGTSPTPTTPLLDEALARLRCGGVLARRVVRRQQGRAGRAEEPHQRPDRDLLRPGPPGHPCGARRRAAGAPPRRPRGPRGDADRDRRAQGDRGPLRDAGRGPGGADGRASATLLAELFAALAGGASDDLDPAFRADFDDAADDAARTRVLLDQVASLTDASAVTWHARLVGDR